MADTHTPESAYLAVKQRLLAAGLKSGVTTRSTGNPATLAASCFTIIPLTGGDTGEMRTRSAGHMSYRINFRIEILHVAPPMKPASDGEQLRLAEMVNVMRHLHEADTDLTREMRVAFGDATWDQPGAGAYLRTTLPIAVQFVMSMALPLPTTT